MKIPCRGLGAVLSHADHLEETGRGWTGPAVGLSVTSVGWDSLAYYLCSESVSTDSRDNEQKVKEMSASNREVVVGFSP